MMLEISAIITTHNRLNDLIVAIDSVRAQTLLPVECIVVDDASSDQTQQWMEENQNEWLRYFRIEKKDSKGGNHARNIGVENARGEFIAFLDDDDIWRATKLEKQASVFDSSKIGMVYCGRERVDEYGNTIMSCDEGYRGNLSEKIYTKIIATTSTFLIKKEDLIKCGAFDEKLSFWQETEMAFRLAQICEIGYVDEPLVIYHAYSNVSRQSNKYGAWIEAINYIRAKHQVSLNDLSFDSRKKFELMVLEDAVNRCNSNNLKKERHSNLLKIYKYNPSFRNFVRYVFNLSNQTIRKLSHRIRGD